MFTNDYAYVYSHVYTHVYTYLHTCLYSYFKLLPNMFTLSHNLILIGIEEGESK